MTIKAIIQTSEEQEEGEDPLQFPLRNLERHQKTRYSNLYDY